MFYTCEWDKDDKITLDNPIAQSAIVNGDTSYFLVYQLMSW